VGYLTDMVIAQAYAKFNRMIILRKVANIMNAINGAKVIDQVTSVHNYLDFQDMTIRKGSIRSYKGERMIIPFNMKDGLAICEGKSNEDWNCSAPHGCGRLMSRASAKKKLKLSDFEKQMSDAGIYSTSVCQNTLDEAPDAYKPMSEIVDLIKDTCDILFFMKPKINIKATESETKFEK
jgi:RNA-splicing ligase RtcB